tara:strand:+ start:176 stop:307 length:132 start_codon:yes stop_codon:yes gene_type:complete
MSYPEQVFDLSPKTSPDLSILKEVMHLIIGEIITHNTIKKKAS